MHRKTIRIKKRKNRDRKYYDSLQNVRTYDFVSSGRNQIKPNVFDNTNKSKIKKQMKMKKTATTKGRMRKLLQSLLKSVKQVSSK